MRLHPSDLYTAALSYTQQGYAVIPVRGDGDINAPKAASVKWEQFKVSRPHPATINNWFAQPQGGLAILTGRVSQLVVLDFDDLAIYERFANQLPELINTYTVRSAGRGTPHLYFKMTTAGLATRHERGVDVLADGCYVVAPPTIINGRAYTVERDLPPLALTTSHAQAILGFLEKSLVISRQSLVKSRQTGRDVMHHVPTDIARVYQNKAGQGRNQALFEAACLGRDQGLSKESVLNALATPHMYMAAPSGHREELPLQRLQEARRTINSVFSRPPRPLRSAQTIPTRVTEALYAQNATYAVRLLNGLRLTGFEAGKTFTAEQALEALNGIVGRDSVYAALKMAVNEDRLFARTAQNLSPRTPHTLNTANAAIETSTFEETNAIGRGQKSGRNKRGRPAALYRMPSNADLNVLFDLPPSAADPMTLDDVRSAKTTRSASHRELIRRRPGTYTRGFLASRLGVDRRTMRGYTRNLGLSVQSTYQQTPIFWHNLNAICDEPLPGTFLQDGDGKRYPPLPEIARRLLKRKKPLWYMRQGANSYSHKEPKDLSIGLSIAPSENLHNEAVQAYWRALYKKPEVTPSTPRTPTAVIESVGREVPPAQLDRVVYSAATPPKWNVSEMEKVAGEVYEAVKRLADQRSQKISRANAQKLVQMYGAAVVSYSLKRLLWLAAQPDYSVTHPAGLLVTLARGNARKVQGC